MIALANKVSLSLMSWFEKKSGNLLPFNAILMAIFVAYEWDKLYSRMQLYFDDYAPDTPRLFFGMLAYKSHYAWGALGLRLCALTLTLLLAAKLCRWLSWRMVGQLNIATICTGAIALWLLVDLVLDLLVFNGLGNAIMFLIAAPVFVSVFFFFKVPTLQILFGIFSAWLALNATRRLEDEKPVEIEPFEDIIDVEERRRM